MEEALSPCPFCGAEAELIRNSSGSYFVRCTNKQCAAKTRLYHENEVGPRLAWNKRVGRTCHMEYADYVWFKCSECGAFVRVKSVSNATSVIPVLYCPNCGAKVASE